MNKKIFLHILFVFLLDSISYAASFPFSGTITTGKDVAIGDDIFKFTYDPQSDKAFVQTPDTSLIIANGNCKGNDYYWICIRSANFSHKNMTSFVDYYTMDVEIERTANESPAKKQAEPAQVAIINTTQPDEILKEEANTTSNKTSANEDIIKSANQTIDETSPLQAQNQQQTAQTESKSPNATAKNLQAENIKPKNSNKKGIFAIIMTAFISFFIWLAIHKIKSRKKPDEKNQIAGVNLDDFMKK